MRAGKTKQKTIATLVAVLAFASLIIYTGCHHSGGDNKTPSTPSDTTTQTTVPTGDTTTLSHGDTVPNNTNTNKKGSLIHEKDSAEITNLRILARKQKVIYDASLLIGEWVRGTEHELYLSNGTGRMWDTSEDVSRDEAQHFNWTLDSNLLTIVCKLELGGVLPKRYVVTFADDENLAYNDLYGKAYLWDKK
ncbi:MAG: hypothetical protein K6D59_01415 [Bacteroidales bacterium]|nr:hypothetical protein [Bacteroidales bacterium]